MFAFLLLDSIRKSRLHFCLPIQKLSSATGVWGIFKTFNGIALRQDAMILNACHAGYVSAVEVNLFLFEILYTPAKLQEIPHTF